MIIDFHTHIFPDKIAQRTIEFLSKKGGATPFSDGTVGGLLSEMSEGGVDLSVTLPVVTNPAQFDSINRFAASINEQYSSSDGKRLISFGGIHPLCDNIEEKMKLIKELGLLGVKIHPDYQETYINDERYIKILEAARELDLIVVTHAGIDMGYRDVPVKCPPQLAKEAIRRVPGVKLVLAHLGGSEMAGEVYYTLCDEDVYFDTAYVLRYTDSEMFNKILKKHGEDRILFATDSPWSGMKEDLEILNSYNLPKETLEKILYKNAKKLLKL